MWGFEHTKACFRDEIIAFVKALKDLFNTFNQYLIDELSEVQNVFHQMEKFVEQHRLESKTFEVKMNQVLNENERLLEQVINKDIVKIIMNYSVDNAYVNVHECEKCLKLETELLNKKDFFEKETYDKLFRSFTTLEKHCISLEEKDLVITALKNELRKLKGKDLADNVVTKHHIAPEMLKIDMEPIAPRLLNNRTAHSDYLRYTQEQAAILREIVEQGKSQNPLNNSLDSALVVTPKNKDKRVRFTEPVTSSGNTNTKTASSSNLVSSKPMLSSTEVNPSTSASGSQPSGNTKKDKIQRIPSSTQKNKVEAHLRTIKSSLKNKNCFVEPKGNANVQHSKLNANSELLCVKCNDCMFSDNHDLCVLDFINDVNVRNKSKSVKKISKRKVWKPTGKVFTNIRYTWRPTGRTFTIVGNACPLTRITTTAEVPLRKPTALESNTPKPVVTLVYSRKPRKSKTNVPISKPKNIKSLSANKKEPSKSWGSIVSNVPSSSINECRSSKLFSNWEYYDLKGLLCGRLGHNLFFMGKFCDSNLEVAFSQQIRFIHNLEGVDLLTGSRGNNLYTLSFGDMMAYSPICVLLKASKTNVMGKSKKKPYKPKSKDTNQEKLYLLHMDLCGPMCVASVNGKKYILVIVDDYSRFTWVKCLRSKDEAPDFIIKFLKMIQVQLKVHLSTSKWLALNREAVATACYTQNHSIVHLRHGKTPYKLLHDKLPDLSFFHVFGALCYLTNDNENLGKLQPKADIGILIGYAPTKKAFRIYNRRTIRIIKTIHVDFDELTVMASEHSSSGPALHEMTLTIISSGLMPNPPPSTPFVPPSRSD
ncbi:retrovirus-related pol polyprotein from transposon TNT 1-94 [Tanacetum coccineum]